MATKARREAVELITKDLQRQASDLQFSINEARRNLKALAEKLTVLKRKRTALFELCAKLEDGLLGPLGRWRPDCCTFGVHYPHCRRATKEPGE